MEYDEVLSKIKENRELAKSFKKAIDEKIGIDEFAGILAGAGLSAADAEEVLAEHQRRRAAVISEENVDEDDLRKVAGGAGAGEEECIEFYVECVSDIFSPEERCTETKYCDFELR